MEYLEAIKEGMGYTDEEAKDACLDIITETEEFPLSYIRFETRDLLGIDWTRPDGTEGFIVLNKKYIVSIAIIYAGDIKLTLKNKEEPDVSYI